MNRKYGTAFEFTDEEREKDYDAVNSLSEGDGIAPLDFMKVK